MLSKTEEVDGNPISPPPASKRSLLGIARIESVNENIKASLSAVLDAGDYPSLCRMCVQQFAGPIPCRRMLAKMQAGRMHGGCYHYTPAYIEPMPARSGIIDAEALQARARLLKEPCAAVLAREALP